jgi:hypothetical protein
LTPVQKARLVGFKASLAQRGILLSLQGTELSFNALVQPFVPDGGEFSVSNETRNASKIHVLRDSPGIEQIAVGSVLADSATACRVTHIEDTPVNIALVFHCETAPLE